MSDNNTSEPLDLSPLSKRVSQCFSVEFPDCKFLEKPTDCDLSNDEKGDSSLGCSTLEDNELPYVNGNFCNLEKSISQAISDSLILAQKRKLLALGTQLRILKKEDLNLDAGGPFTEGGQGKITKGFWGATKVAVKSFLQIDDEDEGMILREIAMLEKIRHPNIINIMGVACLEREFWIIMEYFEGKDLKEQIFSPKRGKGFIKLTENRKIDIAIQVYRGIQFIHTQNPPMLHRDIKPSNVMVNTQGFVKIVDFGLAKMANLEPHLLTDEGGPAKGTLRYVAPEIFTKKEYSTGSDVWSIASTFYELYTGCYIWPEVTGNFLI